MVDKFTKEQRSKIMSAIRSKDTLPEITLRKVLWLMGYRYRLYYSSNKIDIAFPSKKLAIFVDGCFWHGCPIHFREPKSNQAYWLPKIKRNIERDSATNDQLKTEGWTVIRFWEHELKEIDRIVEQINRIINTQK